MQEMTERKERLLEAALAHVAFDGWSDAALMAAARDAGIEPAEARRLFPRGGIGLASAYHEAGDRAMIRALEAADLDGMRFRDKVAFALRARIAAITDREAVRRASALFALPQNAAEGARLIWNTSDAIWTALGDTSQDFNWYSKRATLSAVWASTVLYWLGDESFAADATQSFIKRRIDNVMQFEMAKSRLGDAPLLRPVAGLFGAVSRMVRAPRPATAETHPGRWAPDANTEEGRP